MGFAPGDELGFAPGDEQAMERAETSAIEQIRSVLARHPDVDLDNEDQVRGLFEEVAHTLNEDEKQAVAYDWLYELAEAVNREEG
jgi:hypothetical protein